MEQQQPVEDSDQIRRILLIGQEALPGKSFLEHCRNDVFKFLHGQTKAVYIPPFYEPRFRECFKQDFATICAVFRQGEIEVQSSTSRNMLVGMIEQTQAILLGGSDPLLAMTSIYSDEELAVTISERSRTGIRLVCWGAGAEIAGPTFQHSLKLSPDERRASHEIPGLDLIPYEIVIHSPQFRTEELQTIKELRLRSGLDIPTVHLAEDGVIEVTRDRMRSEEHRYNLVHWPAMEQPLPFLPHHDLILKTCP